MQNANKKSNSNGKRQITKKSINNAMPQGSKPVRNKNKKKNSSKSFGPLVGAPTQVGRSFKNDRPLLNGSRGLRISHRELIGTVTSPANQNGFSIWNRYRVNPGSVATFPWLSTIAPNFEEYRFRKLRFLYETRCPTSTGGSIIMSPDYDAADGSTGQPVATEQKVFANADSVDASVWQESVLELKPSLLNKLYKAHTCMTDVRFSTSVQDEKTIDAAQVYICVDTVNTPAVPLGKLIVEYDIEFFIPQAASEAINAGGAALVTGAGITSNSSLPIPGQSSQPLLNLLSAQELSPLLNITGPLANALAYPTAVIGQFTRDWTGVATVRDADATSIASQSNLWVCPAASLNAAGGTFAGDAQQPAVPGVPFSSTPTGTVQSVTRALNIQAKAGDILKLVTGTSVGGAKGLGVLLGGASELVAGF